MQAVDTSRLGGAEVQLELAFPNLKTFKLESDQGVWYVTTPLEQLSLSMKAVPRKPGLKVRVDPQLK